MVMKKRFGKSIGVSVPAGEFKAKCLQLIDDVHQDDLDLIVTKRGVPMVRVIPFREEKKKPFSSVIGRCGPIRVVGDIVSPLSEEDTIPIDPFLG